MPLCTELKSLKSNLSVTWIVTEEFLGEVAYDPIEQTPENRIFAMFHKDYTNKMKTHIITELRKQTRAKNPFGACDCCIRHGSKCSSSHPHHTF